MTFEKIKKFKRNYYRFAFIRVEIFNFLAKSARYIKNSFSRFAFYTFIYVLTCYKINLKLNRWDSIPLKKHSE